MGHAEERAEIDKVLDEGETVDVAALARGHLTDMLNVLVDAANAKDEDEDNNAPWAVRTRAARDVIEIAEGKPATKDLVKTEQGLTIIINQLFNDGSKEMFIPAAELATTVADAVASEREPGNVAIDDAEIVGETPTD